MECPKCHAGMGSLYKSETFLPSGEQYLAISCRVCSTVIAQKKIETKKIERPPERKKVDTFHKCSKCNKRISAANKGGICRDCLTPDKVYCTRCKSEISKNTKTGLCQSCYFETMVKTKRKQHYCAKCGVKIGAYTKTGMCGPCCQKERSAIMEEIKRRHECDS